MDSGTAQAGEPGDELVDGLGAGAAGVEDLPQEGPEGAAKAVNALSAIVGPASVGESQWAGKGRWKKLASSLGLVGNWALAAWRGCLGEWNLPKRSPVVNIYICIITDIQLDSQAPF
jgi:hypothetical protein